MTLRRLPLGRYDCILIFVISRVTVEKNNSFRLYIGSVGSANLKLDGPTKRLSTYYVINKIAYFDPLPLRY